MRRLIISSIYLVIFCAACSPLPEVQPRKDRADQGDSSDLGPAQDDMRQPADDMSVTPPKDADDDHDQRASASDMGLDLGADQGPTEDTPPDMPPADKTVGVFVLQGHAGRTAISCDGGQSWIAERSDDPQGICFVDGYDCDHSDLSGKGITFGNGYFMATFGWGKPGSIRRSPDGITWTKVHEGATFGGMAFGNGVFVAGSRSSYYSEDDGATWQKSGDITTTLWNVRTVGFVPVGAGLFVLVFGDGDNTDIQLSADNGKTWQQAMTIPAGCGSSPRGNVIAGNGTMLIVSGNGNACTSTNQGKDWSLSAIGGNIESSVVWTGSKFMAWGNGKAYSSPDGVTWSVQDTTPRILPGPTSIAEDGTIVAVRGGWQQWYEKQEFYHSADGVTWTSIDKANFTGSHPGRDMTYGRIAPNATCP